MKNIIIVLLCFASIYNSTAQLKGTYERPVMWVHGLSGNASTWSDAAQATEDGLGGFANKDMVSLKAEYQEEAFFDAANQLDSDIQSLLNTIVSPSTNNGWDIEDNFIIAHSQGGLVSRYLDRNYDNNTTGNRKFGGLVTFGTSHNGAFILNSFNDGTFDDFVARSCEVLGANFLATQYSNAVLSTIATDFINEYQDELADIKFFICNNLLVQALENFTDDLTPPITSQFMEGSALINSLNNHPHNNIEKVNFYSAEDDPSGLRALYFLVNSPNDEDYWDADDDNTYVNFAQANYNNFNTEYQYWSNLYNNQNWWEPPHFENGVPYYKKHMKDMMIANRNIAQWFSDLNRNWEEMIGGTENIVTQSECECTIEDESGSYVYNYTYPVDNPEDCQDSESSTTYEYCDHFYNSSGTYIGPTDGVVTNESSEAFPGALKVPYTGSSHQQMKNDSNLKDRLQELFDGDHGTYFIIPNG